MLKRALAPARAHSCTPIHTNAHVCASIRAERRRARGCSSSATRAPTIIKFNTLINPSVNEISACGVNDGGIEVRGCAKQILQLCRRRTCLSVGVIAISAPPSGGIIPRGDFSLFARRKYLPRYTYANPLLALPARSGETNDVAKFHPRVDDAPGGRAHSFVRQFSFN
jgi:hypothetical protein